MAHSRILGIGEKFPEFTTQACVSTEKGKEFRTVSTQDLKDRWSVVFFWPLDFTFICPTELTEFNKEYRAFKDRGAELFGVSADSHFVHLAWRQNHADLRSLQFPMIADYKKELSRELGVLHPIDEVPLRATYIIDPTGTIRWVSVNDLSVGRSVKEVLRTLDALQTDELCPCNWERDQATLSA